MTTVLGWRSRHAKINNMCIFSPFPFSRKKIFLWYQHVACWPLVPAFTGSNPAEAVGFFGRKNPHTPFFGGEVKPPVPCCALRHVKEPKVTWKSPRSTKFLGHFSPIIPPSAAGFASVASDAGVSCGESWNALNPWFSSKLGVGCTAGNGTQ
jgi:hypothetical protein